MRRLENYVKKYPEFGPKVFHALQSQAAYAGVCSRLRKKMDTLIGKAPVARKAETTTLPLFLESVPLASDNLPVAVSA